MKALLLTARPGIGKTTVIRRVTNALVGERIAGFYTEEQRSRGSRTGFRIVTLDGRSRPMAGIDIRSPQRVGKYGVDVAMIDTVAETALAPEAARCSWWTKSARWSALPGVSSQRSDGYPQPIGSWSRVALKGDGLIAGVKRLPGIVLREVTAQNRKHLPEELIAWVRD